MSEMDSGVISEDQRDHGDGYGLIDILVLLAKNAKLIISIPIIAALIAVALTYITAPVYRASTTLLPPQQPQSGASALLAQFGGAAGALAGAAGAKSQNGVYIGMLRSRTVADNLIQRFSLMQTYDMSSVEKLREKLAESTGVTASKDGLITITVDDTDKARSTQLANAYADELLKLTKVLALTEAARRRVFFEGQLEIAKNKLASSEIELKNTLDSGGVISVDADSRSMIETVGRIRARISAKEVQLSAMRAFITPNNPEFKRGQEELISLRGELSRLENGRPGSRPAASGKQDGLESIKILRDVKYHQMLYEMLAKQYELARLEEAQDAPVIQVLDPALVPERKYKPKRVIVAIGTMGATLILVLFWIFGREGVAHYRALPGVETKLREARSRFRVNR